MVQARVALDREFAVGDIDRRIFGTFVEHIGRCVYGGIYEPGHPTADANGLRGDVVELTKELGVTVVRYPGGNFLSGYRWEDGVGPKDQRPSQVDLAWFATEPNTFGTNEFVDWCRAADVEPMFCVNLGTRGPDEARQLVEYCNHPGGTRLSDLRKEHGYPEPHGIKLWGLGNEQDGPWQIGHKSASEYGSIARESAKLMRWLDPSVELSACGSSFRGMPTYGSWELGVLEECYDDVELLSLHQYFAKEGDDSAGFMATIDEMNLFIREVVAICDAVGAKKRSKRKIMLSFDEYNVWYKAKRDGSLDRPDNWPVGPAFNEELYTLEDALVLGGAMITLLNNCDRVKVACLAQLVNVIAPIMTVNGGAAWKQTIFFPFADASRVGRGQVLRQIVDSPTFKSGAVDDAPYLLSTAILSEDQKSVSFLLLNRHLSEEMSLDVDLRGFDGNWKLGQATTLSHSDLDATNTETAPTTVEPKTLGTVGVSDGGLQATLPPGSWNVVTIERA